MRLHSSVNVAKKLLDLANKENQTLTPMKLIKLVYLCHGWMLGLYGRALIYEPIEAWRYGPVVRNLYDVVKGFRSSPVEDVPGFGSEKPFDPEEENIIQQVYEIYGGDSAIKLSALTHAEGTPWYISWQEGNGQNRVISNDLIQEHFSRLARERSRE